MDIRFAFDLLSLRLLRGFSPLLLVLLLALVACEADSNGTALPVSPLPESVSPEPFQSGLIYRGIACLEQPAYSYALYVPKKADLAEKSPLLLAFDSQGKGAEVVGRYAALADSLGWIIAASNSSQNGQSGEQALAIANASLKDLLDRTAADPRRLYLMGFSGGARVAAFAAQQRGDIAGVIGCAAGFQPNPQGQSFAFHGLVGRDDFNYLEMMQLDRALAPFRSPYRIHVFDGAHAWPPLAELLDAAAWMDFRAMAAGLAEHDQARINARMELLEAGRAAKGSYALWERKRDLLAWMKGLDPLEADLELELNALLKEADYQAERQRLAALEQEEVELRDRYQFELTTKGLEHWQELAPRLRKLGAADSETGHLHMRVVNFLSLVAYSQATAALAQRDLLNAEKYIHIYALVDPQNNEHAYLRGSLLTLRGENGPAIYALQEAVALGFADRMRLESDPVLAPLKGEQGFMDILEALAEKE